MLSFKWLGDKQSGPKEPIPDTGLRAFFCWSSDLGRADHCCLDLSFHRDLRNEFIIEIAINWWAERWGCSYHPKDSTDQQLFRAWMCNDVQREEDACNQTAQNQAWSETTHGLQTIEIQSEWFLWVPLWLHAAVSWQLSLWQARAGTQNVGCHGQTWTGQVRPYLNCFQEHKPRYYAEILWLVQSMDLLIYILWPFCITTEIFNVLNNQDESCRGTRSLRFLGSPICHRGLCKLLAIGLNRMQSFCRAIKKGALIAPLDGRFVPKGKGKQTEKRGLVFDFLNNLYLTAGEYLPDSAHPSSNKRPRHGNYKLDDKALDRKKLRHLPPGKFSDYHRLCQAEFPDEVISKKLFCSVGVPVWKLNQIDFHKISKATNRIPGFPDHWGVDAGLCRAPADTSIDAPCSVQHMCETPINHQEVTIGARAFGTDQRVQGAPWPAVCRQASVLGSKPQWSSIKIASENNIPYFRRYGPGQTYVS